MNNIFSYAKGLTDGITQLLLAFVAIGVLCEVLFGGAVFGVSVVKNMTSIISTLGQNGFAGLMAVLILLALFKKQ